jgi:D-amino-acid dehydrogenase
LTETSRESVTVLGAGIVGIACAIHLQRDGHRVTVVDRLVPGEACSFGNAGILATYACLPIFEPGLIWKVPGMLKDPEGPLAIRFRYLPYLAPWLLRFVRAGRADRRESSAKALRMLVGGAVERHQDLARGSDAVSLLVPSPLVYAYGDEASLAADESSWALRRRMGVPIRVVKGAELRELEPALSPDLGCAVVMEDCGYTTNPSRLVKVLAAHAESRGVRHLRREVRDIAFDDGGGVRLHTDAEDLVSHKLVVAAGAWSGRIAAACGEPVPLEADRGYHVTIRNPGVTLRTAVGSARGRFIATPMEDGLRLAGTTELARLDAPPDYRRAEILLKQAGELFPRVNTTDYTQWMGQRPTIPDSLPVISASKRHAGVYYAFGHQHVGLTSAPMTGSLIADLVAGRRPNIDLEPYRIDRF